MRWLSLAAAAAACVDDDAAVAAGAAAEGVAISGCADARSLCPEAQVRAWCPRTCGECGADAGSTSGVWTGATTSAGPTDGPGAAVYVRLQRASLRAAPLGTFMDRAGGPSNRGEVALAIGACAVLMSLRRDVPFARKSNP